MTMKINKIRTVNGLNNALDKIKPVKQFDAKKHLGKVKWDEDPLDYQKRIRDEWN